MTSIQDSVVSIQLSVFSLIFNNYTLQRLHVTEYSVVNIQWSVSSLSIQSAYDLTTAQFNQRTTIPIFNDYTIQQLQFNNYNYTDVSGQQARFFMMPISTKEPKNHNTKEP